jgi:transposase
MERRRAEWAERVRRWRRSGLTAGEFAASIGVKPGTLTHWAWQLGRSKQERRSGVPVRGGGKHRAQPRFIELVAGALEDGRFELELGNGRRVRIPAGFEAGALARLLEVVGERR